MDPGALRDIHLPHAVGVWPLATGWWIVIISLLLIAAIIIVLTYQHRKPTALKQALAEVDRLFQCTDISEAQRRQKLSLLIRKLAITIDLREEVAHLIGETWISWIESRPSGPLLSSKIKSYLTYGPYRQDQLAEIDLLELQKEIHSLMTAIANPLKQDGRSIRATGHPRFLSMLRAQSQTLRR